MRTVAGAVTLEKNGKYSVDFDSFKTHNGAEYLAMSCTSGAVFDTESEAREGQARAISILESTGMFPNMCEKF